jgi:indole-3-glycerol phosphate synthase
MAPLMPTGVVRVAESGITGPADAAVLAEAGYHAVLVGESIVTSGDRVSAVRALAEVPRGCPGVGGPD